MKPDISINFNRSNKLNNLVKFNILVGIHLTLI